MRAAIPYGHYKTITLVAGLRLSGLVAQKAFDRPMNAATFEEWVEKCLVPNLSPGDIVVIDNLPSHKGPRVEQLVKAAGYLRLSLATLVVTSHAVNVCYGRDFTTQFYLGQIRSGVAPVLPMFFALSGFLVAGSMERCRPLHSFIGLRAIGETRARNRPTRPVLGLKVEKSR